MKKVARIPEKPLLIFDGDCGFCRRWIQRWKSYTGDCVRYEISELESAHYPEITEEEFSRSVQFIETDGSLFQGAEAVFRVLSHSPEKTWIYKIYQKLPLFRTLSEKLYQLIASHRVTFSKITRFFWGDDLTPSTYRFSAWLFTKLMGAVYFFAFLSLAGQILGLVGSQGILPVQSYFKFLYQSYGPAVFFQVPSIFWINASNFALVAACWIGVVCSLLVVAGIYPAWNLLSAWVLYLSLMNAGQDFMSFQWDNLILEAGLLCVFFTSWKKGGKNDLTFPGFKPHSVIRFFLLFLLFRLMFFSGVMKLRSGDPNWLHLSALNYHFETQPLPTWIAWHFHHFPGWFLQAATVVMFGVELILPFFIFLPRRLRLWGASGLITLQILIMLTGNFCFFNILSIALCMLLIDDRVWPSKWFHHFLELDHPKSGETQKPYQWPKWVIASFICLVVVGTADQIPKIFGGSFPILNSLKAIVRPLRSFNQYGLFTVMTTERPEIIIEGSNNRIQWKPYEFIYKPGDLNKRPQFNIPFQPRLDWQMWFAALGNYQDQSWFASFCEKILKGSPDVLRLLKTNPFPDAPPRYIQATLYDYKFSDPDTRKKTGDWWVRERRSLYAPIISLRDNA